MLCWSTRKIMALIAFRPNISGSKGLQTNINPVIKTFLIQPRKTKIIWKSPFLEYGANVHSDKIGVI